jgi:hypothetical protein
VSYLQLGFLLLATSASLVPASGIVYRWASPTKPGEKRTYGGLVLATAAAFLFGPFYILLLVSALLH